MSDNTYSTKNYTAQGGENTVIGGKLTITSDGEIEIEEGATLTGFPKVANQAASAATTIAELKTDFNALLTKLKAAGLMEADSTN